MTTTERRKAQYREATRKNRIEKKALGFIRLELWIKPEWKQVIRDLVNKLRKL